MRVVVFWEAGFPFVDVAPVTRETLVAALRGHNVRFAGVTELAAALAEGDLLVLPHGSAFPTAGWIAILDFFTRGGRWVHPGGAPLTCPVSRVDGKWEVAPEQHACGQQVMIRYTFPVTLPADTQFTLPTPCAPEALALLAPVEVWALQVLLTQGQTITGAVGSSGYRHATLTPLLHAVDGERILAAPIVAIDHHHGAFLGGRWVLAPCRSTAPFTSEILRALCDYAAQPVVQLDARPGFACYQPGESPTLSLRAACPQPVDMTLKLSVRAAGETDLCYAEDYHAVTGLADAYRATPPLPIDTPGPYLVKAEAYLAGQARPIAQSENGFWIYDAELLARVKPLAVNADYFLRDGLPYPVTGTTYMSTVSHRTWLFEPSVAAWEHDFAVMRRAGINLVRTGLWMAWQRAMIEVGSVDEGAIRALQAFLLTAARHDIPVIFTAFAFLPDTWGGTHPYLDPAAVRAQCAFLAALAQRLAPMPHLLWDFINEPSFANNDHLWSCRPNYDRHEEAAWEAWLHAQGGGDVDWRERWRLTPADALGLPALNDFAHPHNLDGRKPLRTMDFIRFAQDAFSRWAAALRDVIRANGNPRQLVTVGQDEAGGMQSPNPHFHGAELDFTSNHSWWQNDDLLWDALLTKTVPRPHLLEETGIMFAERLDTMPWRTAEMSRDLLERKMALSFAGGCAGFIQWLWNTCIYNSCDNEAGIGLLRADGSEKPELQSLREVARFMTAHAHLMVSRRPERTVVIVPHSNLFSVENTAEKATRRSVRTLEYRIGLPCRGASEYFPAGIGAAKLLLLPAARILREECWQALLTKVAGGATLLVSGFIEADEYWREVPRLAPFGLRTTSRPVFHEETITLPDGDTLTAQFPIPPLNGMLDRAVGETGALDCQCWPHGEGRLLYCPLPIEHALAEETTERLYRIAAALAGLHCLKTSPAAGTPGLLVRPVVFAQSTLLLLVNETNLDQQVQLDSAATGEPGRWTATLGVTAGRITLAFVDNATGAILAQHRAGENSYR